MNTRYVKKSLCSLISSTSFFGKEESEDSSRVFFNTINKIEPCCGLFQTLNKTLNKTRTLKRYVVQTYLHLLQPTQSSVKQIILLCIAQKSCITNTLRESFNRLASFGMFCGVHHKRHKAYQRGLRYDQMVERLASSYSFCVLYVFVCHLLAGSIARSMSF